MTTCMAFWLQSLAVASRSLVLCGQALRADLPRQHSRPCPAEGPGLVAFFEFFEKASVVSGPGNKSPDIPQLLTLDRLSEAVNPKPRGNSGPSSSHSQAPWLRSELSRNRAQAEPRGWTGPSVPDIPA